MNTAPQDDLDKRTLKKIISLMFPQYPANHPYHGFTPTSKKRIDKMVELLHQERSRADAEGRIDELNYWFKLIEKNSDEAPIEVSLVKAIKVRLERLATLTQKEQSDDTL